MTDEKRVPNGEEEVVDAEVVEDAEAVESDGNGAADQVERDLDDLGAAQRERDEYLELARRTRADFEKLPQASRQGDLRGARSRQGGARPRAPARDRQSRARPAGG